MFRFNVCVDGLQVAGEADITIEDNYPGSGSGPVCNGITIVRVDERERHIPARLPRPVHIGEVLEGVMRQIELKSWFRKPEREAALRLAIVAAYERSCEAKADEAADRTRIERSIGR